MIRALVLSACLAPVIAAQERTELDGILALYRDYDLPLPGADAELVRLRPFDRSKGRLALLLPKPAKKGLAVVLVGTALQYESQSGLTRVEPTPASAADTTPPTSVAPFGEDTYFALAIQCHALGWSDLADALLALNPRRRGTGDVHRLAWSYWQRQGATPGTDRKVIARHMLLAAIALDLDHYHARYADGMKAASEPHPIRARNPIQQLIDGLLECRGFPTARQVVDDAGVWRGYTHTTRLDPRHAAILERGLAAVPHLIDALDDDRTSRAVSPAIMNKPAQLITIGEIAGSILAELEGSARQHGRTLASQPDAAAMRAWWSSVELNDEGAWLAARILGKGEWPNAVALEMLARRHEPRLPAVYRRLLDERSEMYSHPIVEKIAGSALPEPQKLATLILGGRHERWEHRRAAMFAIRGIGRRHLAPVVNYSLESMPATPKVDYWRCGANPLAQLVVHADDAGTWAMFERAARAADAGMRLEYLQGVMYPRGISEQQKQRRRAFLAGFLDDEAVRDTSKPGFSGPSAAFTIPKIAVRDFAAMQLGYVFGLGQRPDKGWSARQWQELRRTVRDRLGK